MKRGFSRRLGKYNLILEFIALSRKSSYGYLIKEEDSEEEMDLIDKYCIYQDLTLSVKEFNWADTQSKG